MFNSFWLFANPWTIACQAPLFLELCRQEFWSGLPLPTPVEFSSASQLCLTLCEPMDCSTPVFSVHHELPEFTQTHVHHINDSIQPFHPLPSPFPSAFNLSHHWGLFKLVSSSYQVAKVLESQLQHQSFQ